MNQKSIALFVALLYLLLPSQFTPSAKAQIFYLPHEDSVDMLLTNMTLQLQITEGVDYMYNFQFTQAESQFMWLKDKYPTHPLPYFLMGLSNWWKIMPNTESKTHDERFFAYMDSTIFMAEKRYDNYPDTSKKKLEAAFFLSGANAFIGRLYSERKAWTKAAFYGKRALNYMEYCKGKGELSPELLFGDGLFNFYSEWIRENYKYLRPIMWLFPRGDKELGLQQLEKVVADAFYAKIEAQYFLMRIYAFEQSDLKKGILISEYLHQKFPDNPYFHRYYARLLYASGQFVQMKEECQQILDRIEAGKTGYGTISGRYAGFFLGVFYHKVENNFEKATTYYEEAVRYSEESGDTDAGFYLHALSNLGDIEKRKGNYEAAWAYYEKVMENAEHKHSAYKEAKAFKKEYKDYRKNQK